MGNECPLCSNGCMYQDRHDQARKIAHCDECGGEISEKEYLEIMEETKKDGR